MHSALNQTYANLEIVVVVYGPNPDTVKILQDLQEPRLRIVALAENVGVSEARNIGVRNAKGEDGSLSSTMMTNGCRKKRPNKWHPLSTPTPRRTSLCVVA